MKPASLTRDFTPAVSPVSSRFHCNQRENSAEQSSKKVLTPKAKTMKTFVPSNSIILKSVLFIFLSASSLLSRASAGLKSDNGSYQSGADSTTGITVANTLQRADQVTAMLNNNKVDLKWTTAAETNLSHFIIEKSTDGKNFSDAGVVFAYGTATDKTNYSFTDKLTTDQPAVIYYIIRSVNVDGNSQYSETRTIRGGK